MTVSLGDLLTAAKNIATGINGLNQTIQNNAGNRNACALTATTAVSITSGRLVRVSVLVAGTGTGAVYDATMVSVLTNQIYVIPDVVGVYEVNLPVTNGIVVAPGAGQTVTISYS